MGEVELDAPPILENESMHVQESTFGAEDEENNVHVMSSDHDNSMRAIKSQPLDDEIFDDSQDVVGEVIEGSDGEFYLIANDDDDNTGHHHQHHATLSMDNVSEVKLMMQNDESHVLYVDSKDATTSPNVTENAGPRMVFDRHHSAASGSRGLKSRRNRVFGACKCKECGQTFVNTARLERHLAVHQMFGNFSCPLCGKTYKYEYNLFYHWRKTCRDLDDIFSVSERKDLDVNTLRSAVEDLVRKKDDFGPMELGCAPPPGFYGEFHAVQGRRMTQCRACGVAIPPIHMVRHLDLHRGIGDVDQVDHGIYCCDLCGLIFREHFNLYKHWRLSCPELQVHILPDEKVVDSLRLKALVRELMLNVVVGGCIFIASFCYDAMLADTPSPREITLREQARQYESSTADLDFADTMVEEEETNAVALSTYEGHVNEAGGVAIDGTAAAADMVFTDDFIDDNVLTTAPGVSHHNRAKWMTSGLPVQCHECKRSFANVGRLERHIAGFHAMSGTHHCPLCGNRFKYDYNLLYHYRRSCPYTKSFIESEVRSQIDAQTLRKLVHTLCSKDLHLSQAELLGESSNSGNSTTGRAMMTPTHEDWLRSRRHNMLYRPDIMRTLSQIPQNRPGIPEGKTCPICTVMFYGLKVLERHVLAAHPMEYQFFDAVTGNMRDVMCKSDVMEGGGRGRRALSLMKPLAFRSPNTMRVEGGRSDGGRRCSTTAFTANNSNNGPLQIIDDQGNVISEVNNFQEVQQLIDNGHLGLRSTDRFIVVQPNARGEFVSNGNVVYQDGVVARHEYDDVSEDAVAASNQAAYFPGQMGDGSGSGGGGGGVGSSVDVIAEGDVVVGDGAGAAVEHDGVDVKYNLHDVVEYGGGGGGHAGGYGEAERRDDAAGVMAEEAQSAEEATTIERKVFPHHLITEQDGRDVFTAMSEDVSMPLASASSSSSTSTAAAASGMASVRGGGRPQAQRSGVTEAPSRHSQRRRQDRIDSEYEYMPLKRNCRRITKTSIISDTAATTRPR